MGAGETLPLKLHMLFFENDIDIFFDDDDFAEIAKINNKSIKVLFDNEQTISDNGFTQVIGYKPQVEIMNKDIALCGLVEDTEIVIRGRKYIAINIVDEGFGTSIVTMQLI